MPLPQQASARILSPMTCLRESMRPLSDQLTRLKMWRMRRQNREHNQEITGKIIDGLDKDCFDARFRQHWAYFNRGPYSKYLDVRGWLSNAVDRYYLYGCDELRPGSRVLDIGCGAGYFLLVCRHFGHDVLGVDITVHPIFNDMVDFFAIDRIVHRIEPGVPLPDFGKRFDLVTAFMTCFNKRADGSPWDAEEWVQFLTDLREHLVDGGIVVIKFNSNRKTGQLYPRSARRAIETFHEFRASFFRDNLRMIAQ